MFKEDYKKMNNSIKPDPALVNETINRISDPEARPQRRKTAFYKKPLAICAMLMVLLLGSVPVLAANVPAAYEVLYAVSPEAAQYFKPVQKTCVKDGIEMTVLSAYIHGSTAEIYLSMRDLEGERIDETIDLFDSYDIRMPFDSSGTCRLERYDDETKTAVFYVLIESMDKSRDIAGDKITFNLRRFIAGKNEWEGALDFDLSSVGEAAKTEIVSINGGSFSSEGLTPADFPDSARVLAPEAKALWQHGEGAISLSGVGYVDGELHIQMKRLGVHDADNHGYFDLLDENGERVSSSGYLSFRRVENGEQVDYDEYIFDIPQEEIGNYSLYGHFVTASERVDGPWQVTFPLEKEA